jgi:hypothetical protein
MRFARLGAFAVAALFSLFSLGGCAALGLGSSGGGSSSGAKGGSQLQLPEKTVFQGGVAASPTPVPNGSPRRTPLAALPLPPTSTAYAAMSAQASLTGCTGRLQQGVRNGITVVPGTTSAVVTWWNVGDAGLQSYQLAAVPQALVLGLQPAWQWKTVAAGKGCVQITTTVTGLTSKKPYVFLLHAVIKNWGNGPLIAPEIGRSSATMML